MEIQGDTYRFRIWDYQNNVMIYDYCVVSNIVKSQIKTISSSDFIIGAIMPFTGMYDITGKEIYKDDLVKVSLTPVVRVSLTPDYNFESLVYWDRGSFFVTEDYDKFNVYEKYYFHNFSLDENNRIFEFEIIGNKYQ
jgi:hypothetical protein